MKRHTANIITVFRLLGSACMLFLPVLSVPFCIAYLLCGLSDMADGMIARRTGCASEFGSMLDTIADLLFAAAAMVKLLPTLSVPAWLWAWIAGIAAIKICNLLSGWICRRKFTAPHTVLNKITGFMLFLLPMSLPFLDFGYSCTAVCAIATLAAIQEGFTIFRI